MVRTKMRYCKRCHCYTEHIYKGKEPKSREDVALDIIVSVMTMGVYFFMNKISDNRPEYWKCNECGNIKKIE